MCVICKQARRSGRQWGGMTDACWLPAAALPGARREGPPLRCGKRAFVRAVAQRPGGTCRSEVSASREHCCDSRDSNCIVTRRSCVLACACARPFYCLTTMICSVNQKEISLTLTGACSSPLMPGVLAQQLGGQPRFVQICQQPGKALLSSPCIVAHVLHALRAVQLWALPEVRGLTAEELEAAMLEEPEEDVEEAQADAAAADKAEEGRTGVGTNPEVFSVLGFTCSAVLQQSLASCLCRTCHKSGTAEAVQRRCRERLIGSAHGSSLLWMAFKRNSGAVSALRTLEDAHLIDVEGPQGTDQPERDRFNTSPNPSPADVLCRLRLNSRTAQLPSASARARQ